MILKNQKNEVLKIFENRINREEERKKAHSFYKKKELKIDNSQKINNDFFHIKRVNNKFIFSKN